MSRFRPVDHHQLGSYQGGCNCNCTVHAEIAHYAELGVNPRVRSTAPWPPTPSYIRRRMIALGLVPDGCVGSNNAQNGRVLALDYGVVTLQRFDVPITTHMDRIRAGRVAEVTINYKPLHGTRFDSAPTFDLRHAVLELDVRTTLTGAIQHLIDDPMADGRWLYSIGRRALNGPQWWPHTLWLNCIRAAAGGVAGIVDAAAYSLDAMPRVAVVSAGVNIRTGASVGAGLYAKSTSTGIKRASDGVILAPLSASFALQGWVDGSVVAGSAKWAKIRMLGQPRYIHKSLVKLV